MIVTIDGGVASGKSAVGKRVADALGLPFVDSGLMYRAITRLAAERRIDPQDSDATTALAHGTPIRIDGEMFKSPSEQSRLSGCAGFRSGLICLESARRHFDRLAHNFKPSRSGGLQIILTPISFSELPIAESSAAMSLGKIRPMEPIRNVSAWLILPG